MTPAVLRDLFRSEVDDTVAPYLWSDGDVAGYMDAAQKMFCQLVGGISDATSILCNIDISTGEESTMFDARILRIRRIQRDSDAKKLTIVNFEDLDSMCIKLDSQQGPVEYAVIGMEDNLIRWVKVPAADDTASLIIERLPLNTLDSSFRKALEINERHHVALLGWMKHRAYAKQDSDTYDESKSKKYEAEFRQYCFDARNEKDRLHHKPRIVRYGGC